MRRVRGIGPGLMEDDLGIGPLPDPFHQVREVREISVIQPGKVAGLLEGDDVPLLVQEAVQKSLVLQGDDPLFRPFEITVFGFVPDGPFPVMDQIAS